MVSGTHSSDSDLQLLKSQASKYAFYGVLIAGCSVVIATLLVCYVVNGHFNIAGIIAAQRTNIALWVLDALPFIFALWGQYSSVNMAREANNLVTNKTQDLKQALSKAELTSQAKSDFFAKLSHEFRTPINGIIGMTELLFESNLDETQRRNTEIIKASANGLLALINDILDYSRIEAGKLELEEVNFDFHECIKSAAAIFKRQANVKGLTLTAFIHPDIPHRLIGDPGRLRQIIINLVSNAIKFTENGEVSLNAAKHRDWSDGRIQIRVEVADTGTGISQNVQSQLFKSYYQADSSTARKYGGTGLGLSITKELVEAMGGKISVISEDNKGSTFWFTANLQESTQLEISAKTENPDLRSLPDLGSLHVLVADEDTPTRAFLIDQLKIFGIKVDTADDGVVALHKLMTAAKSEQHFDLVLTDMFLQRMTGEELGKKIKSCAEIRDTVIAVMTAAGARGDAQRLNQIGFAGYFGKPIPTEDLQEIVHSLMATSEMQENERQRYGLITKYTLVEKHRHRRILLAEDSDINREIILGMLAKYGLTADTALNGREAVDAVQKAHNGLVLLDLRMPVMNGIEALQTIRALPGKRGYVPVVILTAGATETEIEQCKISGVNGLLFKPIEAASFAKMLARWLEIHTIQAPNNTSFVLQPDENNLEPDLELIKIFLHESEQRLDALRCAVAASDAQVIAREAHTLKSNSAYIKDVSVYETAAQLESLANAGKLDRAPSLLAELERAYASLRPKLEKKLANQS